MLIPRERDAGPDHVGASNRRRTTTQGAARRRIRAPISRAGISAGLLFVAAGLAPTPEAAGAENAQALYDQGLAAMLKEQFEQGCPMIEQSYAMDPQPGALFTLAACYARWGKVHTASARYRSFLALVERMSTEERESQQDRATAAREKLEELRPQVPTVTLSLGGSLPAGAAVELDGRTLTTAEVGSPIPVDPGAHTIVLRRGDTPAGRERTVEVAAGESKRVNLSFDGTGESADDTEGEEPGDVSDAVSDGSTLRTAGYAIGALGLAGVVVGAITGGMVFGKKGTVEDNCVDAVCNQEGLDAADEANTLATVSNVGFGVGLGALAVGVVLVLVAPDDEASEEYARAPVMVTAAPTTNGAGVGLVGRW